jgi:nondiscriminating glutamyl-tRNA synthetase
VIRTRFAPSPTGSIHVGNARIAVLNWLFARHHGGCFILRIEDTDVERNVPGAEAGIREDLLWLGLDWDEGPDHAGTYGPYRQSERTPTYRRYAARLLESGAAYACYCEPGPIGDDPFDHVERRERCACATATGDAGRADDGAAFVVRFRVDPTATITFDDRARGRVEVGGAEIADFVILRRDGRPTYNFAVVVDDIEMKVSHVIRGVGHLSNTPRQVLLYDALGVVPPAFVHVPMVLGPDRQKLSKRHGATGIADYRAAGYHPGGIVNYLSLLSWSSPSGEEVLTREQLVAEISLDRIGVADVMFDPVKLRWLSGKHIERMPLPELVKAVRPYIDVDRFELDDDRIAAAIVAVRTHLSTFADINEQLEAFFPDQPPAAVGGAVVPAAHSVLSSVATWDADTLRDAIQAVARETGVKGRDLYEPLRRALTGREHGPPLPAVLFVQGRERALQRLDAAV